MFLDSFKPESLTVQIQYQPVYPIWDLAGTIAKQVNAIWPGLEPQGTNPNEQIFKGKGVTVVTGIKVSTITLWAMKSLLEARTIGQLKDTLDVWRRELSLDSVSRVSSRAIYVMELPSLREANASLLKLGLVRWPTSKVFGQAEDGEKNGVEVLYKFEDAEGFSYLRLKAEEVKFEVALDPPFEDRSVKDVKHRVVVDFDRGLLGTIRMGEFRVEDWLRGFQHVLRRDIEKVVGSHP